MFYTLAREVSPRFSISRLKNFLELPEVEKLTEIEHVHLFWGKQSLKSPFWVITKFKNQLVLTFSFIKTAWGIARWHRLFLHIATVLKKCLGTYYDFIVQLENFLRRSEIERFFNNCLLFSYIFWIPRSQSQQKRGNEQKSACAHVFATKTFAMCHAVMPFVFARTNDPKEVFNNLKWHCRSVRKSFTSLRSTRWFSKTSIFCSFFDLFWSKRSKKEQK